MKKVNYLNNKDLLKEIHKSKTTYCSYVDQSYADFDIILPSIDKINVRTIAEAKRNKAKKLGTAEYEARKLAGEKVKQAECAIDYRKMEKNELIFRIMSFEHIPEDLTRKKTKKTVADSHVKVNFPPFQHWKFDDKGNLFTLTNYRNDNLNGVHKVFDWSRGVRNIKKECFYSVFSKTQTIRANFYIDDDRPVISMNYKYIYHNTVNGNFLSESYERRKDGKYDVINFFHGTETVRAKGVQWFNDSDIELEHGWLQGKWTFYHSSGTKESEHTFLNNRLITSSIYYEDNTLIQKIEHAQ